MEVCCPRAHHSTEFWPLPSTIPLTPPSSSSPTTILPNPMGFLRHFLSRPSCYIRHPDYHLLPENDFLSLREIPLISGFSFADTFTHCPSHHPLRVDAPQGLSSTLFSHCACPWLILLSAATTINLTSGPSSALSLYLQPFNPSCQLNVSA